MMHRQTDHTMYGVSTFIFAEFDDSSHALCFCSNAGLFEWTLVGNTFKMRFVCACFDRKKTKMKKTSIFDCKLPIANCQSAILFTI